MTMFIHFFCLCHLGLAIKLKLNTVEPHQFELGYYEFSVIPNSKSFPLVMLFSSVLFFRRVFEFGLMSIFNYIQFRRALNNLCL